jgi:hypothetical protein
MTRKTIELDKIKTIANGMLRNSRDEMVQEREAIATLLESILMSVDSYQGFGYIGGYREGMDETRRVYY